MDYAIIERIGNIELFTVRKAKLAYLYKWINDIKEEKVHSNAIIDRRKMEKTALMERFSNIKFLKNDRLFPFLLRNKRNQKKKYQEELFNKRLGRRIVALLSIKKLKEE